jgi:hypothetical protein
MVIKLAQEDAFKAATTALSLYGAYLSAVAQEIGMDRALAIQNKTFESMGAHQGQMMREQSHLQEHNAQTAWALISTIPKTLGVDLKVEEESPQRVSVRCDRCSVFEAAQSLEMDVKGIEAFCKAGPNRFMDAMARQLNPDLKFQVGKFRSSSDDFCEEELTLER